MNYYITEYVGSGTVANPYRPGGTDVLTSWSSIDLSPPGVGATALVSTEETLKLTSTREQLAATSDEPLTSVRRNRLSNRLSVSLTSERFNSIVAELLIEHARQDGSRWKPLRSTSGRFEIWLGDLIWTMPVLQGGASYTETFNKADSATLGPNLTWTEVTGEWEVFSNTARLAATGVGVVSTARAESDLASSNHYAQATVTDLGTGTEALWAGPACRFSSSANTCYVTFPYRGDGKQYLRKIVAGTETDIATSVAITISIPEVYKVQADGSTIKGFQANVERLSVTDTSITGNTRCGLAGWYSGGGPPPPRWDDFLAADLSQRARPVSDVAAGGWTASTGTDLFAMVDEESVNDADYITAAGT